MPRYEIRLEVEAPTHDYVSRVIKAIIGWVYDPSGMPHFKIKEYSSIEIPASEKSNDSL